MYPKTITISDDKLKNLLIKKGELIISGRAKTDEIIKIEQEMLGLDIKIQEEEKKVNISDLNDKQKAISAKVDEAIKEMEEVKKEIFDRMTKQTNPEFRTQYEEFRKRLEVLETERNKIALKAQKYNDKIMPMGRELIKPFLVDTYDDYDSLFIENEEITATIFNHLVDFKINFKKK